MLVATSCMAKACSFWPTQALCHLPESRHRIWNLAFSLRGVCEELKPHRIHEHCDKTTISEEGGGSCSPKPSPRSWFGFADCRMATGGVLDLSGSVLRTGLCKHRQRSRPDPRGFGNCPNIVEACLFPFSLVGFNMGCSSSRIFQSALFVSLIGCECSRQAVSAIFSRRPTIRPSSAEIYVGRCFPAGTAREELVRRRGPN